MRVAAEATEEELHLFVHHRVLGDGVDELGFLRRVRQFAVQQQVARFHEVGVDGQLFDRVTTVQQLALVAVDVGDRRVAGGRRHKAWVVGELAATGVQFADVDDVRANRAFVDWKFKRWAAIGERQGSFCVRDIHGLFLLGSESKLKSKILAAIRNAIRRCYSAPLAPFAIYRPGV
ncbi:hypothetical protein D3C72_1247370 [compost metagenome]